MNNIIRSLAVMIIGVILVGLSIPGVMLFGMWVMILPFIGFVFTLVGLVKFEEALIEAKSNREMNGEGKLCRNSNYSCYCYLYILLCIFGI